MGNKIIKQLTKFVPSIMDVLQDGIRRKSNDTKSTNGTEGTKDTDVTDSLWDVIVSLCEAGNWTTNRYVAI